MEVKPTHVDEQLVSYGQEAKTETYPKMVSTNQEADKVNEERLANLPGDTHVFPAEEGGKSRPQPQP